MYYGMLVDTDNFVNKTGVRTFEAAAYLKRNGADLTKVRKMSRESMETYRIRAKAISEAEIFIWQVRDRNTGRNRCGQPYCYWCTGSE